ncbi:bifunctional phosphopantothenoylcysteine decarboxylase/phosphopantothenate--cysteine ligase CoaBC [bacterium]|nr:bifunctional phosphopantothenoylcysteine decarboxylase/phosphopantothenate--cysteine ligase CoaBC [bacterium]
MLTLKNKSILIGITGGIAAYKVCSLIRLYKKAGADVRVVVTPNALNFVTKLTLQSLSQNEVYVESFDMEEYKPEHIALTDSDIFVIAPASANTISKIANGICDNLLLTTACAFKNPILLVPAMNTNMWENPFVQENLNKLREKGYNVLEPDSGFLACGDTGVGRMREIEDIFDKTIEIFMRNKPLFGKKILITAGGTKEKIDPVRYITNCSSGKMGIALAENAADMGAEVTLVSTFKSEGNYTNIVAETAREMEKVVKDNLFDNDCVIMAAAVADWRAENYSAEKMKKGDEDTLTIKMVKNPDILKEICGMRESIQGKDLPLIVGFCAESENLIENAKTKIQKKGCDFIVANDISRKDIGFNSDENEVYIIDKELSINKLEKNTKHNIAKNILEEVFNFSKTATIK